MRVAITVSVEGPKPTHEGALDVERSLRFGKGSSTRRECRTAAENGSSEVDILLTFLGDVVDSDSERQTCTGKTQFPDSPLRAMLIGLGSRD